MTHCGLSFDLCCVWFLPDPLNQANGCNDESDHTSSDEGISSEEADDYQSYSEFVKKNTVCLISLCHLAYAYVVYSKDRGLRISSF